MKRGFIIFMLVLLFILNACSNKGEVTGSAVKEVNNTKKPLPYMMDSNLCIIMDDASSPMILNKNCRVDSDCYGAAKAFGVEDMDNVRCS